MADSSIPTDEINIDDVATLPSQNRRSLWAMLAVQALNAFNDNFVKILLVAFAGVVAKGTELGSSMQLYLGAIFSLPYILFAPVAGWLSDRYSKQRVILWMQVAQVIIFAAFHAALMLRETQLTLWLSLGCFFLLATQCAFFSPAKMGIAKELVGSRRLGSVSGTLQLTNFMGILSGMGFAGWWFGSRIQQWADASRDVETLKTVSHGTPFLENVWAVSSHHMTTGLYGAAWDSVNLLVGIVTFIAILQIIGSFFIQRTPEHTNLKFHQGIWVEHFGHLKLLFSQRPLKLAALGITYFWFMSNAVGSILVTLSHEMHPTDAGAATKAMSMMPAMLGIGVMLGSVLAGMICRKRIELGLVPVSGFALALTLFWSGIAALSPWVYAALIGVGMAGGAFMTPLYAYVQDRARPDERARILSAINLLDCAGAIVANMIVVKTMLTFEVPSSIQLLVLVPVTLAAALFVTKLLPQGVLRMIGLAVVRTFYKLKVHHHDRIPREGAVLLLPNHMSYADAVMLGAGCERDVRFVMLDSLYNIPKAKWAFQAFGTVPISATKAREAIRTVSEALKKQQAVVLFPEGQITRTGFFNEIRKGYEIMARMGGDAKVQPVWMDGLWGSIFSFEGGLFFKKRPQLMPYRVSLWFGEPMEAREATPEKVREALCALSAEAFGARNISQKVPRLVMPDGSVLSTADCQIHHLNALRIRETNLLLKGDTILCLLSPEHPMAKTFGIAFSKLRNVDVCWNVESLKTKPRQRVVTVGDASAIEKAGPIVGDVIVLTTDTATAHNIKPTDGNVYTALYDADLHALLAINVPDPKMPADEIGLQVGHKAGSVGHLLPGLSVRRVENTLIIGGIIPNSANVVELKGFRMDGDGFLFVVREDV